MHCPVQHKQIDQTLLNTLHDPLNCETGEIDYRVLCYCKIVSNSSPS